MDPFLFLFFVCFAFLDGWDKRRDIFFVLLLAALFQFNYEMFFKAVLIVTFHRNAWFQTYPLANIVMQETMLFYEYEVTFIIISFISEVKTIGN